MLKHLDPILMVGILAKDVPVASVVWYRSGLKRARKDPTDKGTFDVCYVKYNVQCAQMFSRWRCLICRRGTGDRVIVSPGAPTPPGSVLGHLGTNNQRFLDR